MRIAVCDDEKICRDEIIKNITPYKNSYSEMEITEFSCGENLIEAYESGNQFDIIFLDIQMKNFDGVETAKKIRETDRNALIIFITSHTKFVPDTFRVNAFQYLTKPVKKEDIITDFERAVEKYKIDNSKHIIKWKDKTYTFEIKDIYYIESYYRHLFICNGENKFESFGKLSDIENKFNNYSFVRCHRNIMVNMSYIESIGQGEILLKNKEEIPISKNMRKSTIDTYNNYISRYYL